jgi:hypothetical protein
MTDLERENAALREENARLSRERESLAAEWGLQQIDLHHLRAHVAALVRVIADVRLGLGFQSSTSAHEAYTKLGAALDAGEKPS